MFDEDPVTFDRAALVAIYNATGGPSWQNSQNWVSDRPIGEWWGVVAHKGRVTHLRLRYLRNRLTAPLPDEACNLKYLIEPDLTVWCSTR